MGCVLVPFKVDALQGRIQVRLRGGGEFQLVELIYILGESNLSRKGCNEDLRGPVRAVGYLHR